MPATESQPVPNVEEALDAARTWADQLCGDIALIPFKDSQPDWSINRRDLDWPDIDLDPADVPRLAIVIDSFHSIDADIPMGSGVTVIAWWDQNGAETVRAIEGVPAYTKHCEGIIARSIASGWPVIYRKRPEPIPAAPDSAPSGDVAGISLLSFSEFKAQENSTAGALIKGLVRTGTLIAIGGRPGAGKTALTLAIAGALDAGEPFLGRETKPTTVVIIAAEDGGDVANRLEAMGNDRIKIAKLPEGLPLTKPMKAAAVTREVIRQAKALDPDREVMVVVDTLRAALGGVSVLEDKTTSPALNALRGVAESEGAVVAILNHTNRENNKATKGETLEAVAALELVLLEGEGDWFQIYVGKNRSGPGHRNIGKVRYTSANVGDVSAAVVDELVADESVTDGPKERAPSGNARILRDTIQAAILQSEDRHRPFGDDGPNVKVVTIDAVRALFYERKEGSTDTKLKAFNRALTHWIDKEWIVRGDGREGGLLWLASVRDEKAGQPDGHIPTKASVLSVRLEDTGQDGRGHRDKTVLSGSESESE